MSDRTHTDSRTQEEDRFTAGEVVMTGPKAKWAVTAVAGIFTALIAGWALIAPEQSATLLGAIVGWTSNWFGWFYIALATVILLFVIYLGVRYRNIRLGKDSDRPEFSTFSWAAMLFAAGIGTDIMFFAVAEPATQFLAPPQTDPASFDAAREATVWTMFHYGITGWGMYALMGLALGYCSYRLGLPLAVRSALYPLMGKRAQGRLGDAVDIATVLGTIFGVATSLGIGVVMLNVGIDILFDIPQGIPAQIGLVVLAVTVATVSAVTGVDKGIRILSQLNVLLAVFLAAWVLVTGDTAFLLRATVMNVGDFVSMFPGITLGTMAFDYPADWMSAWTLFFWAWWVAWASFVGMFLARISRGRTIGQFVLGSLSIPFSYIVMWICIFGNSALQRIIDGDAEFGQIAMNKPELGFFTLLQGYPGAAFLIGLSTFVGLLFYVTSADSGALVMANLCSELPDNDHDAKPMMRIVWAAATGVLTIAMLLVGGIGALQSATIIMGLPFSFVLVAVMFSMHKALEKERRHSTAFRHQLTSSVVGRGHGAEDWRTRLAQVFGNVTPKQADERFTSVVVPALESVRKALAEEDVQAALQVDDLGTEGRILRTATLSVQGETVPFTYTVRIRRSPAPVFGARFPEARDMTTILAVELPSGGGYDLMGYSEEQVCHDVLDHYQRWASTAVEASPLLSP